MDELERDVLKNYNKGVYNRLGADVSVTELLNPPRVVHLQNRHGRKPVTDIKKVMPSLIGNGIHDQLQRYLKDEARINNNWLIERKLLTVVDGVRVAGRFDALYNNSILYDIKTTKVYKIKKGDYSDWETQLNLYSYMLLQDGVKCTDLRIFVVVLDWSPVSLLKDKSRKYPSSSIFTISLPLWEASRAEAFITTTVNSWLSAKTLSDKDLPLCTPSDRWADPPEYKLFRHPTHKRATKVFPSAKRAGQYFRVCYQKDPLKWKHGYIKKEVTNPWKRCQQDWCSVSDVCLQYQNKIT